MEAGILLQMTATAGRSMSVRREIRMAISSFSVPGATGTETFRSSAHGPPAILARPTMGDSRIGRTATDVMMATTTMTATKAAATDTGTATVTAGVKATTATSAKFPSSPTALEEI